MIVLNLEVLKMFVVSCVELKYFIRKCCFILGGGFMMRLVLFMMIRWLGVSNFENENYS